MKGNPTLVNELLIDHACDRFEAEYRESASFPDLDRFLDSVSAFCQDTPVDPAFRNELATEIIRLRISLMQQQGLEVDLEQLCSEMPSFRKQIDTAASSIRLRKSRPRSERNDSGSGQPYIQRAWNEAALKQYQPGDRLGQFELKEHLGQGGMGTVWRAWQTEPVKREVALKLIRSGRFDTQMLSRFRAERQALAVLGHPHVAHMFDASQTDDGQPYLVMELVDGPPLTEFADQQQLDLKQRIELFIPVCRAVQHAHQKGIIHRDLKPSNILVSSHHGKPVAKVIDFGLAKATETQLTEDSLHTQQGQVLGTPDYMSPEQTRLGRTDVDTRSDIYSLGAVLYELLTGQKPFGDYRLGELPLDEALHIVREVEPVRPSQRVLQRSGSSSAPAPATTTLEKSEHHRPIQYGSGKVAELDRSGWSKPLRGELDWIVMACLEKDRSRRYESAAALAADLESYLHGEPVKVAPPSRAYQLKKMVSQNRSLLIGVATVMLALIAGLAGTGAALNWALQEREAAKEAEAKVAAQATELLEALTRARNSEAEATARANDLQQVTDFQGRQVLKIEPAMIGQQIRQSLIDQRREILVKQNKSPEQLESDLNAFNQEIAFVNFTDVGQATLKVDFFERLEKQVNQQFQDRAEIRVALLESLADSAHDLGSLEVAYRIQQPVVELRMALSGERHEATLASKSKLGLYLHELSRYDEADRVLAPLADLCRQVLKRGHLTTIDTFLNKSRNLQRMGRFDEAETQVREARTLAVETYGSNSGIARRATQLMGQILSELRKYDEAERLLKSNLEIARQTLQPEDREYIAAVGEYGKVLERMRRWEEAEPLLRECLDLCEKHFGRFHPVTLDAINNLGSFLTMWKNQREALVVLEDSLERQRRVLGDYHQKTLVAEQSVAVPRFFMKDYEKAIEIFEDVLPRLETIAGKDNEATVLVRANLGINYRASGNLEKALQYLEEAYAQRLASHDLAFIPKELFDTCLQAKKRERAREIALEELRQVNQRSPQPTPERLLALWPVANWLLRSELWPDAESALQECLSIRNQFEAGDWKQFDNQSVLGEALMEQGKMEEAGKLLQGGYEELAKVADKIPPAWRRNHIPGALGRLVEFHKRQGNAEKSEHYAALLEAYLEGLKK